MTAERFYEWKAKKLKAKQDAEEKKKQELEAKQAKAGGNVLSGKALFAYDPTLFKDDDAAEDKYDVSEIPEDEKAPEGETEVDILNEEPDVDLDALDDEDDETGEN